MPVSQVAQIVRFLLERGLRFRDLGFLRRLRSESMPPRSRSAWLGQRPAGELGLLAPSPGPGPPLEAGSTLSPQVACYLE